MRKVIIGAAILAAGIAAVRLGPSLAERGMKKCHDMFTQMGDGAHEACACAPERMQAATS